MSKIAFQLKCIKNVYSSHTVNLEKKPKGLLKSRKEIYLEKKIPLFEFAKGFPSRDSMGFFSACAFTRRECQAS